MTLPALSRPALSPLDEAREAWRDQDRTEFLRRHEFKREQSRRTWDLYLHWCIVTRLSSRRQFMVWLTEEPDPATRLYDLLNAGRALSAGLDFDLGVSDLSLLGRALDRLTPAEVQEKLEAGGVAAIRALIVQQRQEGQVSLPTAELPAVREAVRRVSESETLPAPEALALIVQAHEALPATVRESALLAARTGQPLEDAARAVVVRMLDPRAWLAARPCAVPGCGLPTSDLHHLRLPDTRFRTQELLIGLCRRHHEAEPGHTSDAAHAHTQADWIARFWPDEASFWRDLSALYATRLFQETSLNPVWED